MRTDKTQHGIKFSRLSRWSLRLRNFDAEFFRLSVVKPLPGNQFDSKTYLWDAMRKAVLASILLLLVLWLSHPYLSRAIEGPPPPTPVSLDVPAHPSNIGPVLSAADSSSDAQTLPPNVSVVRGRAGYWRLAQDKSGVWWFMSPDGQLEFLNTVTTVQPTQLSRNPDGAHFVSLDWKGNADGEGSQENLDRWAQATIQRVRDAGFKGLGAWCNPALHRFDIPMSQDLNLWSWIQDSSKRLYTSDWQTMAEQAVKMQVVTLADNRNLVGYYIDNELDWGDGFAGPNVYFDHLPVSDPNRQEVVKVIQSIWPTVSDFNFAWGTKLTAWSEVDSWTSLPHLPASAFDRLSAAWISHLAEDYFRITTNLIRRYDPNHLILGVRFKGYAPEEVVLASRNYTDAQSLNYYVSDAKLDAEMFRMMYERSGQPIVISEYSFHSLDGHSGNPDTVGFAAQVPDQQARADGYRLMTTRLARVPYIVGADWFQWCDEPPGGRGGDGEDVNFGVVDIHDKPYDQLVAAIRQTAPLLDGMHGKSGEGIPQDVWRDSYATKPAMEVPYLATAPTLDDNLADWPAAAKLYGVRREQTVGLERFPVATPNIYLGWTHDGLYLGCEVFDDERTVAPAEGWWWTRDNIEFWIATRSVTSDQNNYDPYCHQFFVVPTGGDNQGSSVVGQWHRDGDTLKDNLIPDAEIKQVTRLLPDRYIVEMFIPAKALNGFDPVHHPELSFNIHVRDFKKAADFFWSAPKSQQTQLRPSTWGSLVLLAPKGSSPLASAIAAPIH
jgi:hypothetical protein